MIKRKIYLLLFFLFFSLFGTMLFKTNAKSDSSIINSTITSDESTSENIVSSSESSLISENIVSSLFSEEENISSSINSSFESNPVLNTPKNPIKIYLNPSVQIKNIYYDKITTEEEIMLKVAKKAYETLIEDSIYKVYINDTKMSLSNSVSESNKLNVDIHIALHTNAGGGRGSEAYYKSNNELAKKLLESFDKYHNFKNRGVKQTNSLYELNNIKAPNAALIEFLFHDNEEEGKFLKENVEIMAKSLVEAIEKVKEIK